MALGPVSGQLDGLLGVVDALLEDPLLITVIPGVVSDPIFDPGHPPISPVRILALYKGFLAFAQDFSCPGQVSPLLIEAVRLLDETFVLLGAAERRQEDDE